MVMLIDSFMPTRCPRVEEVIEFSTLRISEWMRVGVYAYASVCQSDRPWNMTGESIPGGRGQHSYKEYV